jgi:hypothetical protein
VLLAAKRMHNKESALKVGLDRRKVALWRARFLEGGIDALRKDAPRPGRPASVTSAMESRSMNATLHGQPANSTHWSTRTLAEHLGSGATSVRTVRRSNGLLDVVGLYLNPPEHALVLAATRRAGSRRSIARSPVCR